MKELKECSFNIRYRDGKVRIEVTDCESRVNLISMAIDSDVFLNASMGQLANERVNYSHGDLTLIGKKIDGFSLRDFRGKVHALGDYSDSKAVVVAFIGIECPLARLYAPRLTELAKSGKKFYDR